MPADAAAHPSPEAVPAINGARRVAADGLLGRVVGWTLLLALAGGLVVPKAAGAGYLLLATLGIAWLSLRGGWFRPRLAAHEKLLILAVGLYVGVWLLAWLAHGADPDQGPGGALRLLLILPVYFLVRRVDGLERYWWRGLTLGALAAGAYALWFHLSGQVGAFYHRVDGPTNPIYFGGLALAFALMLLPRVVDQGLPGRLRLLVSVAVLAGLVASVLSASRGAWLALPPLLLLYIFTLGYRQPPRWRFGLPAVLGLVTALVCVTPLAPLGERFGEGAQALQRLLSGQSPSGTLGLRWEMWQLAGEILREHPLFGAGPAAFREHLLAAVDAGALSEQFAGYRHPHSQYLSALLTAGIPGLVTLLLLIALPALRCVRLWQSGLERTRMLGWCGLAALAVLATMAISESIFERNTGIVWFGLLTAGATGLVQARRRRELYAARPARRQSLSVIMICRDEADRIGRALESVSGWADEIIVLDSGSTDGTVDIARRHADRVEVTDWPGFGIQKQRALDRAGGDWVLNLDADEGVSDELRREIDLVLARSHPRFEGYRLPWSIFAFGGHHQFGHWSRAPLRLFRRDACRFPPVAVHEKPEFTSRQFRAGLLDGPLIHHVYRDLDHARAKLAAYARLQAGERARAGRRSSRAGAWLRAAFNFGDNYLLRAAFLDGRAGWIMCRLHAAYTLDKYRTLARLHRSGDND